MARLKFGALVSKMSGSIGGSTLQRSSFGHSIRSKPLPIHSRKPLQLIRRSWMSEIQSAWSALTEIQRNLWRQFISYSGQSINNDSSIQISGYNLFLKYQFCRKLCNLPLLVEFTYIPIPQWPQAFIFSNVSNQLFIQFDRVISDNEYFFILSVSNPRVPSKSYSPQNCRYMFCVRSNSDTFSFTETYIQNFGLLAQTGDTVHFSIYYFSLLAPLLSGYSTGKAIIGAQFPNQVNPIPPSALLTFSPQSSEGVISIGGVIYADNQFLLWSYYTTGYHFATSPDGLTWTPYVTGPALQIFNVCWSGSFYIAVCSFNAVWYLYFSSNGSSWSAFNSSPSNINYYAVSDGLSVFLTSFVYPVTTAYRIDGLNSIVSLGTISPRLFSDPAYYSGLFVAVDSRTSPLRFCYSTDFINWSYSSFLIVGYPSNIIFGNGIFCCVNNGSEGPFSWVSANGSTWSASVSSLPLLAPKLCFGDGYFWCHSQGYDSSPIYRSVDGLNWLPASDPISYNNFGIAAGANRVVMVGGFPDLILTSD